ncbi:MAG TPA: hypothetical protein VM261_32780, partial [Kofleriaceae bacterium]|nr:hypothetical protein [Kofleriaceae bacterium]
DLEGIHLLDAQSGAVISRLSRLPAVGDLAITPDAAYAIGTSGTNWGQRWVFVMRLSGPGLSGSGR